MNQQTGHAYYLLFKKVFEIIHRLSGQPVQFFYLHGTGIETIVVDMDEGQRDGIFSFIYCLITD
jgi:hypothetical protein